MRTVEVFNTETCKFETRYIDNCGCIGRVVKPLKVKRCKPIKVKRCKPVICVEYIYC